MGRGLGYSPAHKWPELPWGHPFAPPPWLSQAVAPTNGKHKPATLRTLRKELAEGAAGEGSWEAVRNEFLTELHTAGQHDFLPTCYKWERSSKYVTWNLELVTC
ncbi:unnamed protein product, partial [Gulo gulo]